MALHSHPLLRQRERAMEAFGIVSMLSSDLNVQLVAKVNTGQYVWPNMPGYVWRLGAKPGFGESYTAVPTGTPGPTRSEDTVDEG